MRFYAAAALAPLIAVRAPLDRMSHCMTLSGQKRSEGLLSIKAKQIRTALGEVLPAILAIPIETRNEFGVFVSSCAGYTKTHREQVALSSGSARV